MAQFILIYPSSGIIPSVSDKENENRVYRAIAQIVHLSREKAKGKCYDQFPFADYIFRS